MLGKLDDDAVGATDIGQPVCILVLHLANEFRAMCLHPGNDYIEAIDGKQDATKRAWCSRCPGKTKAPGNEGYWGLLHGILERAKGIEPSKTVL
ncbi:hypothetical protein VXJ36_09205 [Pseudomonas nitroreducens]|uniref:hypothetical protein n=1 Tax=Pseudomonas nitroreducens TaxID=46680 RepID=UPI002F35430A